MSDVQRTPDGFWTLTEGDTARTIAQYAYGDGNRYADLLEVNKDRTWATGNQVLVPDKKCVSAVVQEGDTPHSILRRMFPGQMPHLYLKHFMDWNGDTVDLPVGKLVFCPAER